MDLSRRCRRVVPAVPATLRLLRTTLCCAVLLGLPRAAGAAGAPAWSGFGGDPRHTAVSGVASQPLDHVAWQTSVDLIPHYSSSGTLLIHYGSPLVTGANTVLIPVKTGALDGFRVEARNGGTGSELWQFDTDFTVPAHGWIPSCGIALAPSNRLWVPGAGGTVFQLDGVDTAGVPAPVRVAFYGTAAYEANPTAYNADIRICTPLTSDSTGNVFFGFRAAGANPLAIHSGLARIGADGSAAFVTASTASAGRSTQVLMNCAPAMSNDGQTIYVVMSSKIGDATGYLVALDATTLATRAKVQLKDPKSGHNANLYDDGSSSPAVGPDGRVFFGVVESPAASNRGWMLQFDANLASSGAPGSFGWDDTPSVVPASMVPSYTGLSSYLLTTKYNSYADLGGDGINKLAVLDPRATQVDPRTGATVMKEVLTVAAVTPDTEYTATHPGAVKEWCINTSAVDPFTNSVYAGNEDGVLYRWDLATNTLSESVVLTPGIGEAYTPTVIGHDGRVYAINNGTLFSVGVTLAAVPAARGAGPQLRLAVTGSNPFTTATSIRFSLAQSSRARLEILDIGGRSVTTLFDGDVPAGDHWVRWNGRGADGRRTPAGVYFARVTAGDRSASRRIVLAR